MRWAEIAGELDSQLAVAFTLFAKEVELVLFVAEMILNNLKVVINLSTHNNPVLVRISLFSRASLSGINPTLSRVAESNRSRQNVGLRMPNS
jgi:hypothetical protein